MTLCLAVDPGISSGWALFTISGELIRCCQGNPPLSWFGSVCPAKTLIERPQIYARSKSKGDPNDLITLALLAGRYQERFDRWGSSVEFVLPHEWKGTLDKAICHERMWCSLNPQEQAAVHRGGLAVSPKKREDMLDACAMGKWKWGNLRFTGQKK